MFEELNLTFNFMDLITMFEEQFWFNNLVRVNNKIWSISFGSN